MAKGTKYSQEFKEDAVRYRLEHPEMALRKCAENLGISESALKNCRYFLQRTDRI